VSQIAFIVGPVALICLWPLMFAGQGGGQRAEPSTSSAEAEIYAVDPVHSSNWFRIRHLNVAHFYGRFNELEGTFALSEADPAACAFDIRVKAESIDTHNIDRDKHLKSAEFFDVEKYPLITFKSRNVRRVDSGTLEVTGELTLRGVSKPLTVKLERTGTGRGMRGEHRAGFETAFEIRRSEFGMTGLMSSLGDDVRLTFSIEGVRQ